MRIKINNIHFKGGSHETYKTLGLYYLISARYENRVVYGLNIDEIAKKLGMSSYLFRKYINRLERIGFVRREKVRGTLYFRVRSLRKIDRRIRGRVSGLMLRPYDTFKTIQEKLRIHNVKTVIQSQDYIRDRIETLNAKLPEGSYESMKRCAKDVSRYTKKYGASDFELNVIGQRRMAERVGLSLSELNRTINLLEDLGILKRRFIIEKNHNEYYKRKFGLRKTGPHNRSQLGYYYEGRNGSVICHYGTYYEVTSNVVYLPVQRRIKERLDSGFYKTLSKGAINDVSKQVNDVCAFSVLWSAIYSKAVASNGRIDAECIDSLLFRKSINRKKIENFQKFGFLDFSSFSSLSSSINNNRTLSIESTTSSISPEVYHYHLGVAFNCSKTEKI